MLWWVPTVAAVPVFRADEPSLVRRAERVWALATECAGHEAPAAPVVELEIGPVKGGFEGRAFIEARVSTGSDGAAAREYGLSRIRFAEWNPAPRTVAHEVSHAWVHGGPPALVEGATDLLADCVSESAPAEFPPESRTIGSLGSLVDLTAWENGDEQRSSRSAGYAASAELFRLLADAVPRQTLWRPEWTWEAFDAVLDGAGAMGRHLSKALRGGVETQRAALSDADDDGMVGVRELLAGTDPTKWDTDGDGWWDGAPADLRAHGVPLRRGLSCGGRAAGPSGAVVTLRGGTWRRESPVPRLRVDGLEAGDQTQPFHLAPGGSILLQSSSDGWALIEGEGLVPDARCWSDEDWLVLAAPGRDRAVKPFVAALLRASVLADAFLPRAGDRRVVWIGEPSPPLWQTTVTRVPDGWLERAAGGEWDFVAAYAVAEARLQGTPLLDRVVGDTALYEALARALTQPAKPPDVLLAALEEEDVTAWTARAAACPGGWRALVEGTCPGEDAVGAP